MKNNNCCEPKKAAIGSRHIKGIKAKVQTEGEEPVTTPDPAGGKDSCGCSGNSCCPSQSKEPPARKESWITGWLKTDAGYVPQVAVTLSFHDRLGAWKARWGINRMNYKINPGLYAAGNPDPSSPVLVTANYKLTFDVLRKELAGLNAWLLVLDTKGINVWCAAGKGTFGTEEIVRRAAAVKLDRVVSHRTLILPQLGAPGVSALEVTRQSSFHVVYGPVRASDIQEFIAAGMKATPEMRKVHFNVVDRLVLTPIELTGTLKMTMMIFGALFLLNGTGLWRFGIVDIYAYLGALLAGCVLTPVLLPWIPGRAFSWKGGLLGLVWALIVNLLNGWPMAPEYGWLKAVGYLLVLPSVSAFYSMNFTGASTYTSPSGVLKEMGKAVPIIILAVSAGILMILAGGIIRL